MKAPIFICGHRKSGTTMLHKLFDNHQALFVYPIDLNLLYAYYPVFLKPNHSNEERLKRLDIILFKELEYRLKIDNLEKEIDINLLRKTFFERLKPKDLRSVEIIIKKLLSTYIEVTNQKDKTPVIKETSIEIYMHKILKWFPESKVIHLVRDPRDNYGALKSGVKDYYSKLGEDEKITLASLIHRTRIGLMTGLLNEKKFGKERYSFVNFNYLLESPKIVMTEISEFLKIDYSDKLLQPSLFGKTFKGNNFKGKKFTGINNKNNNRWQERISEEEAKVIEFHLGDLMEKFDYKRCFDRFEALVSASNFYEWKNYKFYFNDRFKPS